MKARITILAVALLSLMLTVGVPLAGQWTFNGQWTFG